MLAARRALPCACRAAGCRGRAAALVRWAPRAAGRARGGCRAAAGSRGRRWPTTGPRGRWSTRSSSAARRARRGSWPRRSPPTPAGAARRRRAGARPGASRARPRRAASTRRAVLAGALARAHRACRWPRCSCAAAAARRQVGQGAARACSRDLGIAAARAGRRPRRAGRRRPHDRRDAGGVRPRGAGCAGPRASPPWPTRGSSDDVR